MLLWQAMPLVGQDIRYGARLLWKAPGFTAVALAALSLGIGATTAIFSVVDAVLLKPLPFPDPERLVAIWENNPAAGPESTFVAPANFHEWQRQSRSFESLAAIRDGYVNLNGGPGGYMEPEELHAERVSAGLFQLLGVRPVLGRTFREDEDQPGRADLALLSHRLWTRRFGADRGITGKSIRLGDRGYTVVGVLPAGFSVLSADVDLWTPLALPADSGREGDFRYLQVIGRLRPGVEIEQARPEMETIAARLEQANPARDKGWRPLLVSMREELAGNVERALFTLFAAVLLLLLMACANIASLLLARGAARRKELAIRVALGASRWRMCAQLLAESILLSLAGGALGTALAWGAVRLLARFGPGNIPRLAEATVDARLLLFALAVSIGAGILFGLVPALQATRANANAPLSEGGRGGTAGRAARGIRHGLVVFEVALAVIVLIGAGLLMRSFARLRAADPGFQTSNLLTFRLRLSGGRNSAPEKRIAFFRELETRLAALPGVRAAGAVNALPLSGLSVGSGYAEAGSAARSDQRPSALIRSVSPSYFGTMGIPLVSGRGFLPSDVPGAPLVVVVNRKLASRLGPGRNPLGVRLVTDSFPGQAVEIVGVVGDVKPERLESEDWPTIYSPYPQAAAATMIVVVRTAPDPVSLASAVRSEVRRLDPDQPVADLATMEDVLGRVVARPRFNAALLGIFAWIAFTLAAVGIYGVISYDVSRRTNEIGVRAALGAAPTDIFRLVLGEGARLAACGIALGLLAAFALTRLMTKLLYGIHPADAWTFGGMALLLGAVALAASYLPSRRAMKLDPIAALRHE